MFGYTPASDGVVSLFLKVGSLGSEYHGNLSLCSQPEQWWFFDLLIKPYLLGGIGGVDPHEFLKKSPGKVSQETVCFFFGGGFT